MAAGNKFPATLGYTQVLQDRRQTGVNHRLVMLPASIDRRYGTQKVV